MKHFEPYFAALEGLEFVTRLDRENALWALFWAAQARGRSDEDLPPFRPPLIAILGPSGVGKSVFAKRISDTAGTLGFMVDIEESTLGHLAMMGSSVACFDDVFFTCATAKLLGRFLVAEKWSFRPLRKKEKVSVPLNCITIVTSTAGSLPEDLSKKAVVIRLGKRASA